MQCEKEELYGSEGPYPRLIARELIGSGVNGEINAINEISPDHKPFQRNAGLSTSQSVPFKSSRRRSQWTTRRGRSSRRSMRAASASPASSRIGAPARRWPASTTCSGRH
jgi:hypothetical protein